MITIVYNVLARREEYVELGADYYDRRNKPKTVSRLVARLIKLGYCVDLKPVEPDLSNEAALPEPEGPSSMTVESDAQDHTAVAPTRKRGRPCKCVERGIICKHGRAMEVNLQIPETSSPVRFS